MTMTLRKKLRLISSYIDRSKII